MKRIALSIAATFLVAGTVAVSQGAASTMAKGASWDSTSNTVAFGASWDSGASWDAAPVKSTARGASWD